MKNASIAIAAIIASLSAASAQTSAETFQRHNRWMVGGAVHMELERIRGTHNKNELDFWGGGVLMGAAAGKRFALNNDDELSLFLGIDCILGPWYANVPVSLGIRYGF